jgi:hypothetical protein
MLKSLQAFLALIGLALFAFWLYVALPLLYAPDYDNEVLGVKYGEWLMFAATVLLCVATIGLWWATSTLVKGAEKTAEQQLRAYVMLDRASLKSGEDHRYYIDLAFKNWGNTPARNGVIRFEMAVNETIEAHQVLPLTEKAETSRNFVFAPGHRQVVPINRNEIGWVQRGGGWGNAAYVWGRLDCDDAFDKPRFTTFQLVHTFNEVEEFVLCSVGNDAR